MRFLKTIDELEAHYGAAHDAAVRKVADRLTPLYRQWIMASKFCVLSTVGPEGTDGSPRGDDGPVVEVLDESTLIMPDWQGNNRLDSLRNILRDPRVSLMFMHGGSNVVVRVNGTARLTADEELRARFERKGMLPALVVLFDVKEVYVQCSKALLRSGLWKQDGAEALPTLGQILADMTSNDVDGVAFDRSWPEKAQETLW